VAFTRKLHRTVDRECAQSGAGTPCPHSDKGSVPTIGTPISLVNRARAQQIAGKISQAINRETGIFVRSQHCLPKPVGGPIYKA